MVSFIKNTQIKFNMFKFIFLTQILVLGYASASLAAEPRQLDSHIQQTQPFSYDFVPPIHQPQLLPLNMPQLSSASDITYLPPTVASESLYSTTSVDTSCQGNNSTVVSSSSVIKQAVFHSTMHTEIASSG